MRRRSFLAFLLLLTLTACGGSSTAIPQATLTPFPTFNFTQPTEAPVVLTIAAETQTASSSQALDPEKVAQGKGRYEALACGSCHGAEGKGTDKGKALVPNKLTEDQFVSFLRSGGTVGNSHLFSTNRLSDVGSKNLYLYVLSLSAGS